MRSIASISLYAAVYGAISAAADPIPAVILGRAPPTTYQGCYSSGQGLNFSASLQYNSRIACQAQCAPSGVAVEATTSKTDCWCGNVLPPASAKVDDSFCNDSCAGYDQEMCGAAGSTYFSVYLSGYGVLSSSSASSASPSSTSTSTPSTSSTTSAKPSLVTVAPSSITVTASSSAHPSSTSSSSGPSKAGIAAGVIVGVVAVAAIAGGIFLFLRNQRRRAVEEEYKRNAAAASFSAGAKAPNSSAGTSFNDTRLDPVMAQRRFSDGSIADNQDYSRRILKVTNA